MKNSKVKIGIIIGICAVIAFVGIGTAVVLGSRPSNVGTIANGVGSEINTMGNATSNTHNYGSNENNAQSHNQSYAQTQKPDDTYPKDDTEYVNSYDAMMSVKTKDLDKAYNNFCQKATEAGAEIYEHTYHYNDKTGIGYANIAMLVPNEKYESVLQIARQTGTITDENTSIERVEVPDEDASSSSASSSKTGEYYSYYGSTRYDMSKYSEFSLNINDDDEYFISTEGLYEVAQVAANLFLMLIIFLIPVAIVIAIIIAINRSANKRNAKKENTAQDTPVQSSDRINE